MKVVPLESVLTYFLRSTKVSFLEMYAKIQENELCMRTKMCKPNVWILNTKSSTKFLKKEETPYSQAYVFTNTNPL